MSYDGIGTASTGGSWHGEKLERRRVRPTTLLSAQVSMSLAQLRKNRQRAHRRNSVCAKSGPSMMYRSCAGILENQKPNLSLRGSDRYPFSEEETLGFQDPGQATAWSDKLHQAMRS